jgi:hypothetical protein
LKDDIAAAKAKLASNDTEIFDAAVTTTSNWSEHSGQKD